LIKTLDEFFANLQQAGFLMLNATPVLHPGRKPVLEARYWQAFLEPLLFSIAQQSDAKITLLLWGKIAQQVEAMPVSQYYDKLVCEHPYNLSFIDNPQMLRLFADLAPLQQRQTPAPPENQ
jgi:uracil-DNA glycosylase